METSELIEAYKRLDNDEMYDKDEIFVKVCDLFYDINVLNHHEYLIFIGIAYQIITEYVNSTYMKG